MLNNDDGIGLEHGGVEDQLGHFGKIFQVVGGIGKDYVEFFSAGLHKLEHIALDEIQIYVAKAFSDTFDEPVLYGGFFDCRHLGAFARQELDGYGSCPGKQVKSVLSFKVHKIFKDVEYVFTGKIGGGSSRYVARHVKAPSAIFSSYYSHNGKTIRSNGAFMVSFAALNMVDGNMTGIT